MPQFQFSDICHDFLVSMFGARFFSLLLSAVFFPVSNTKQQKMDPEEEELSNSTAKITDDLVVEILSRLPFKSFCRFKCVCKSWLAFSSDPHYSQKLPKVPTGFFYQYRDNSGVQFVSLSKNDEGIDGTLSFLSHYEQLKFIDCCNGLVLCEYSSSHTCPDILSFILCVTQQHGSGEYFLILNESQTTSVIQQFWALIHHGHHTFVSSTFMGMVTLTIFIMVPGQLRCFHLATPCG